MPNQCPYHSARYRAERLQGRPTTVDRVRQQVPVDLSICSIEVPIIRAISNVAIPAAIAKLANVCRSAYGPMFQACGPDGGVPVVPAPPVAEVDVLAGRGREQQRGVEARGEDVQRIDDPAGERDKPGDRPRRLADVFHLAVDIDAADVKNTADDVAPFQCQPFFGP